MKKFSFILILMILAGCKQQSKSRQTSNTDLQNTSNEVLNDSLSLQNLIRDMYRWESTERLQKDFLPVEIAQDESFFHNLDMASHERSLKEITDSGFFTTDFINQYDRLGLLINHYLTERIFIWQSGEIPPFSSGAYDWCNCQDTPSEDFYNNITIKNIIINDNIATFSWLWNAGNEWDNVSYQVKARKENGIWKIFSLQGFEELQERLQAMTLK